MKKMKNGESVVLIPNFTFSNYNKMKKLFVIISISIAVVSCNNNNKTDQPANYGNAKERFASFSNRFIENFWQHNPEYASSVGFRKYDSKLTVITPEYVKNETAFYSTYLDSINKYDISGLEQNEQADLELMKNQCELQLFYLNEYKSYQWNPASYNLAAGIAEMLVGTYAPLEERLLPIAERISNAKAYFDAAMANINNPTYEHLQLAISQNEGSINVLSKDFPDSVNASKLDAETKKKLLVIGAEASKNQQEYINWLKKPEQQNNAKRSFRLDKDLYAKKFKLEMFSGYSADEIYKKALQRKSELHSKMFVLATKLWNKYQGKKPVPSDSLETIRIIVEALSREHTKPDKFQETIEKQIPQLEAFVTKKDLITLDPQKPLVVRKEPAYMSGVAGASISSPGPYDKNANTYYNVGSLANYNKADAESYLREYNNYTLQILNIHEAIPGHYTQLVYANNSPSIIKSVFGNSTMIEGWAVYGELMMLENGYPNIDKPADDEMWFMYYKWNLRSVCNTILDYSIHNLNMEREKAMDLLQRQAFQQKAEAENKWKRATLTNVQLCCYFTGFTEILELRENMKAKQGEKFNLKQWHEQFLSYGSAPVKLISRFMNS